MRHRVQIRFGVQRRVQRVDRRVAVKRPAPWEQLKQHTPEREDVGAMIGRTFIATSRRKFASRARYTSPIPPAPNLPRMRYGPI